MDQTQANGDDRIAVGALKNLYAYSPASPSGTDLAIVNAGFPIDSAPLTPVVVFADQIAAANFLTTYASASTGGSMTLSTVTASNGNIGTFQGIIGNANPNTGDEIKSTIAANDGDSGGVATVVAGKNNTTYAVGILSTSDQNGQNARFTTINDGAYVEANAALGKGFDPSTMPADLIVGATSKEHIRGSVRKADIITNGDNDVILAGSGGGLINTETGKNDFVFLPAAYGQHDAGTTVVFTPGTTTVVGAGANDRLVLLTDRIGDGSGVVDSSPTLILGGGGNDVYGNGSQFDFNGNGFNIDYTFNPYGDDQNDLFVTVEAAQGDAGWSGSVLIKDFEQGDLGLVLGNGGNPLSAGFDAGDVNDDSSVNWGGDYSYVYSGNYGDPDGRTTEASGIDLSAYLRAALADTAGDGGDGGAPPPPPPNGSPGLIAVAEFEQDRTQLDASSGLISDLSGRGPV